MGHIHTIGVNRGYDVRFMRSNNDTFEGKRSPSIEQLFDRKLEEYEWVSECEIKRERERDTTTALIHMMKLVFVVVVVVG